MCGERHVSVDREQIISNLSFVGTWKNALFITPRKLITPVLHIYGEPGSLSHYFKIWPITFEGSVGVNTVKHVLNSH